jgi:hypothetical protein
MKRGTLTLFASEVLNYPQQQIRYAHASNVSVYLLILVVVEIVQISDARI